MGSSRNSGNDQWLLDASLALLVVYNVVFLVDVAVAESVPGQWAARFMAFIDARRGWVTLFEAIAAVSVFVDLIVRFDAYPDRSRGWRVAAVGLAMAGLVFKAFAFYLDSAYLE